MTAPDKIEKLMSLTAQEFADTLARLGPSTCHPGGEHTFDLSGGTVAITYVPLPGVTLGGLLALPRANVTLAFENVDDEARKSFLKRFELTFQRGGG